MRSYLRILTFTLLALFICATTVHSLTKQEQWMQHVAIADYYLNKQDITNAIIQYQTALKINPRLINIRYKLGQIYLKQGLYRFAITEFNKIISKSSSPAPNTAIILDAYLALANSYYALGLKIDTKSGVFIHILQMEKALKELIKRCEAFKPSHRLHYTINKNYYLGKSYYILARMYRDKNHEVLAPKFFQKALTYGYKKAECYYFLWEYHFHKKEHKKAKEYKGKAIKLDKNILKKNLSKPLINYFRKK